VGAGAWVVLGPVDLSSATRSGWLTAAVQLCDELVDRGVGTLVLDHWSFDAEPLDAFVLAAALADATATHRSATLSLGAHVALGAGRAASIAVRELTALDHLAPGRGALLLSGQGERLAQGAAVAGALLGGSPATAGGTFEGVVDAPNLPAPVTDLRAAICVVDLASGEAQALDQDRRALRRASSFAELGHPSPDALVMLDLRGRAAPFS